MGHVAGQQTTIGLSSQIGGETVKKDSRTGCLKPIKSLSQESRDDSGQDVPHPSRRHRGVAGGIDPSGAAIGDNRSMSLQYANQMMFAR